MNKEIIEFLRESNAIEREYDAISLADSIFAWEYLSDRPKIGWEEIMETHKILMKRMNPRIAGKKRKCDVWVGGYKAPNAEEIRRRLSGWIENYKNPKTKEEIKKAHIEFEKIHPFEDGNGRVGRIIMNIQRVRAKLPILVIKEDEKFEYYKWF